MTALRLRASALQGKEHKRQRTALNRRLYELENGDEYVAAISALRREQRHARDVASEEARTADEAQHTQRVCDSSGTRKGSCTLTAAEQRHFRSEVTDMFDEYAPTFEAQLRKLCYQTPAKIEAALVQSLRQGETFISSSLAIDLGCGTGLAGVALRSRCRGHLVGCDLSSGMIARAAQKRQPGSGPAVYDSLTECDLIAFLHQMSPASADLIVAADVLVYMRNLSDLFEGVEAVLAPGGRFALALSISCAAC